MARLIYLLIILPYFLFGCFGASYISGLNRASIDQSPPQQPAPPKIINKIVAGGHTCVVHDQGMDCWGANSSSQLGINGAATTVLSPLSVFSNQTIDAVAVGAAHTCVLINGGVKCVGTGTSGQLGQGNTLNSSVYLDVFPAGSGVTNVATSNYSSCAVVSDGLYCWGSNGNMQLGNGNTIDQISPVQIFSAGSGVTKVAMGQYVTCAVVNAEVWCWGRNSQGQVGDGTTTDRSAPAKVTAIGVGVSDISAGERHVCAIKNGGLYCWGYNIYGQIGDNSTTNRTLPVSIYPAASGVSSVSLGSNHSCVLVNGQLDCWGANTSGQLNDLVSYNSKLVPTMVLDASNNLTHLSSGAESVCVVENNLKIYCWGSAILGNGVVGNSVMWPLPEAVQGLTANVEKLMRTHTLNDDGNYQNCSIVNGGVQCWGTNSNGILGNGTTIASNAPVVAIPALSGVTDLAVISGTNNASSCAVVAGGLQCWGNGYGTSPVSLIAGGSSVTAVNVTQYDSFGDDYGCVLINGGVSCWGINSYGQLGDGTTTARAAPVVAIAALSSATQVEVRLGSSCAIVNSGLRCWGMNDTGQLGDGTTTNRLSAVQIFANGSGVTDVVILGDWHSEGQATTCAVINGGLKCWGYNADGLVGDGTTINRLTPVDIFTAGSGVTQVASSGYNICALKNSGLFCWGANYYGSLGIGSTGSRNTPTEVFPEGSGVTDFDIGVYNGCAILAGGLKCWGLGGSVGEGTIADQLRPVEVFPAGSNVQEVRNIFDTVSCARVNNTEKCWGFDYGYGLVGNGRVSRGIFSVEGF